VQPADGHERHDPGTGPEDVQRVRPQRRELPEVLRRALGDEREQADDEREEHEEEQVARLRRARPGGGEVQFPADVSLPLVEPRNARVSHVHETDQREQDDRRQVEQRRRPAIRDDVVKDEAHAHADEHAHQHQVREEAQVPDVAGQVADEAQFEEQSQEAEQEQPGRRPDPRRASLRAHDAHPDPISIFAGSGDTATDVTLSSARRPAAGSLFGTIGP